MLERWSAGGRGSVEQQVQGGVESLDPFRADRIFALDERLTRQFGKTLAMLIRLRDLRATGSGTT